jgi:hypothetical protein
MTINEVLITHDYFMLEFTAVMIVFHKKGRKISKVLLTQPNLLHLKLL